MRALLPAVPYPVGLNFEMEPRVLLFATLVTTGAALVFGLAPALQASRPDLVPALKDEIGQGKGSRGRLQSALVIAQVALSLVTLASAGLFVRSLEAYRSLDSGMSQVRRVLLVDTDLRLSGIRSDLAHVSVVREVLDRVRVLPGVEAAAVARAVPLGPGEMSTAATRIEGYTPRPDEDMNVSHNDVAGDYFRTVGIRLIEGRAISDADVSGNAPVVVVNETFARRYLAGRTAIGARLASGSDEWLTIVGLVATSKINDYTEAPEPVVFRPYSTRFAPGRFTLHVRAAGDPVALTSAVRRAIAQVDAELPSMDARRMAEFITIPYWPQKVGAMMLMAVGVLALLLATIGIHAIMAYHVGQRLREIGVRVALGAGRRDVLGLVLGRALCLVALGLALGLAGALAAGRLLQSQLLGVSGSDPGTFAAVSAILAAVALGASWAPAWRAVRVDPTVALRYE
jgi:predicted permease